MRVLTNLFLKVTVSSMALTAPAVIDGNPNAGGSLLGREAESPYASSFVIKNYIHHLRIWPVRAYVDRKSMVMSFPYVSPAAAVSPAGSVSPAASIASPTSVVSATSIEKKVE